MLLISWTVHLQERIQCLRGTWQKALDFRHGVTMVITLRTAPPWLWFIVCVMCVRACMRVCVSVCVWVSVCVFNSSTLSLSRSLSLSPLLPLIPYWLALLPRSTLSLRTQGTASVSPSPAKASWLQSGAGWGIIPQWFYQSHTLISPVSLSGFVSATSSLPLTGGLLPVAGLTGKPRKQVMQDQFSEINCKWHSMTTSSGQIWRDQMINMILQSSSHHS